MPAKKFCLLEIPVAHAGFEIFFEVLIPLPPNAGTAGILLAKQCQRRNFEPEL